MNRRLRRTAVLALTLLLPAAAAGQVSANAGNAATAVVSTTALVATVNRNLDFGFRFPGSGALTISPAAGTQRAEVEIHGTRNAEMNITFAMPANLVNGANTLPITFGAGSGCHLNRLTPPGPACTLFNPAGGLTVRIRNQTFPNNTYFIWLGGSINVPVGQAPGTYAATITLTTTYTGN